MERPLNRLLSPLKDTTPGNRCDAKVLGEIVKTKCRIFDEICREINVENHNEIKSVFLNKRTVSKESLCLWLEAVCGLVDSFCIPGLQEVMGRCEIQNQRITDAQRKLIDLQLKTIQKKDQELATLKSAVKEELKSVESTVQSTVQSQMISYSAVLSKTCSAALSQKKIQSAVKSATDKEDRKKNLVIYGVSETPGEEILDKASEILLEVGEKPSVKDCCRIGRRNGDAPRPVKLCLSSSDIAQQVLRKARLLRMKEGYKSVYICPDRTVEERVAYKKLFGELRTVRRAEPDKFFTIKNNKVVRVSDEKHSATGADS